MTRHEAPKRKMFVAAAAGAMAFALATSLVAHVELRPQVSTQGAEQQYTVRAHNESKVSVTSIELEVPAEVTIVDVPAPATGTREMKREGNRIIAIVWTREIKSGSFADFRFSARNPAGGSQITWHARERHADGTITEWGGTAAGHKAAPTTKLSAPGKP